jgi:hypothetical protein
MFRTLNLRQNGRLISAIWEKWEDLRANFAENEQVWNVVRKF